MLNNNYVVKEYFDLNNHYLKISFVNNQDIHIVSYDSKLLNGIKYETVIRTEEIMKKSQSSDLSCEKLYELINQKICDNKYIINSDANGTKIILLETNHILNQNNDIQIVIPKNQSHKTTEYEKVLSNEIKKLKEENKNLLNAINELRNINELNKCIRNNNNMNNSIHKNRGSNKINNSNNPNSSKIDMNQNNVKNSGNINNSLSNSSKKYNNNPSLGQPKIDIKNINNNNNLKILNNSNNIDNNSYSNENNNSGNISNVNNGSSVQNSISDKQKETTNLSLSRLCNLQFGNYPQVELSPNAFFKISGYGANSYNGISRKYNEDRIKIILEHKLNKEVKNSKGKITNPNISYFAIYDGHGGNKCSIFLQENLHEYIFNSNDFPLYPLQAIYQAYEKAELNFESVAFDKENKKLLDKSGSCALSALIIDDFCFIINLGDSRGLYSFDSGKQLFQVTRDHKPNDNTEKKRIEQAGGKIYKDTRLKVDGVKIRVSEKEAPGFRFPYRVSPGNLAVSIYYILFNLNKGSKKYWRFWF